MSFQSFYGKRKLLREEIYNKRLVVSKLGKLSKSLYNNVKSNLNVIDFHHVLNIYECL